MRVLNNICSIITSSILILGILFSVLFLLAKDASASIVGLDTTFGGTGYVTHHNAAGGNGTIMV